MVPLDAVGAHAGVAVVVPIGFVLDKHPSVLAHDISEAKHPLYLVAFLAAMAEYLAAVDETTDETKQSTQRRFTLRLLAVALLSNSNYCSLPRGSMHHRHLRMARRNTTRPPNTMGFCFIFPLTILRRRWLKYGIAYECSRKQSGLEWYLAAIRSEDSIDAPPLPAQGSEPLVLIHQIKLNGCHDRSRILCWEAK